MRKKQIPKKDRTGQSTWMGRHQKPMSERNVQPGHWKNTPKVEYQNLEGDRKLNLMLVCAQNKLIQFQNSQLLFPSFNNTLILANFWHAVVTTLKLKYTFRGPKNKKVVILESKVGMKYELGT